MLIYVVRNMLIYMIRKKDWVKMVQEVKGTPPKSSLFDYMGAYFLKKTSPKSYFRGLRAEYLCPL